MLGAERTWWHFLIRNFEWGRWNTTVNTVDSTGLAWICVPLTLDGAGTFKQSRVGAMSCSQWCFVQILVCYTNNRSSWARNNWSFVTRKLLHWIRRFPPSFYNKTCYCLTRCVHTWKFPAHPIKRTCMLRFNARSRRMNAAIWIRCLVSNPRVQTSGSRFRFSLDWLN